MKFGVVIFPSKSLQDLANSYRKRYDPHYALITPHVTLKNAFEATETQAQELSDQLRSLAKNYQPFTLKTTKISSFHPVNNVIYLKVEKTPELEGLYQDMDTYLKGDGPALEFAFVPHITIGQNLSNDEHSDVYGSMKMQRIEREETVDRFHLLYQLDNGSWTVYETFRLGGDS